jgi:hypothetical protein
VLVVEHTTEAWAAALTRMVEDAELARAPGRGRPGLGRDAHDRADAARGG